MIMNAYISFILGVTLVTQCSVDHLYHLPALTERWSGPISIAVFAPDHHAALALQFIAALLYCSESVRDNVTFHLAYPLSHPPTGISQLQLEQITPEDCKVSVCVYAQYVGCDPFSHVML